MAIASQQWHWRWKRTCHPPSLDHDPRCCGRFLLLLLLLLAPLSLTITWRSCAFCFAHHKLTRERLGWRRSSVIDVLRVLGTAASDNDNDNNGATSTNGNSNNNGANDNAD